MSARTTLAAVWALVETTDGHRQVAQVEVLKAVRLRCGCTQLEGIRPGPETEHTRAWTEGTGRPPMVHLLTGCEFHRNGVIEEVETP